MAAPAPFAPGVVAMAGSRRLPFHARPLVHLAVVGLAGSGFGLSVGCCAGADAVALALASRVWPGQVQCFAIFAPGGAGAFRSSAVAVVRRAAACGASVRWLAGGSLALPLRARLAARTRAVIGAASAGLVAFFASPASRGSLLACRLALARGLPVLAFPLGFPGSALPSLGVGRWLPFAGAGVWRGAWAWRPAQSGLLP